MWIGGAIVINKDSAQTAIQFKGEPRTKSVPTGVPSIPGQNIHHDSFSSSVVCGVCSGSAAG
jgi:hypothetical protein